MKNLVFQVNIKPNGGRSEGRKKFHYVSDVYEFSNLKASDINQITGDDNQNVKGLLKYIGNPVTSAEINFPDFKDVKLVSGSVNIEPIIDRQEFVLNQIFEVFVNQVNQKISGYLR